MKTNTQHRQAALKRLERFSQLTDSSIRFPFTNFRFGIEAVIGFVPVVGDVIGLILSSYVLFEAHKLGISWHVKLRIIINMLIDFFIGSIPLFGDIFDAFFKANTRNTLILKKYITKQLNKNSNG
ncbi:hypothetical protein ATS72_000865 [Pseudoalteromonas sp. 13-15]|uniref:DUF4112 domain-containing protein n=1 Tax=Pseudoalteromonas TaxID=53246 RepID=UPI0007310AD3|nr:MULTISPECIES: DUF4112 domain-containing protein [Pseudoalteromonas]AUL72255.1 hypothetical protein ATS72_000865 [Pseudoalteromonas sp. 13-15]MCK8119818.1 DUF4112 domain-containing protein [Pseudoalteromonas sp. 2CM32C]WFO19878.1 DUF4112 domain-containing protein [Pseudoalteromonas sp. H100]SIN73834.1 protein of unknown function [Pseudoalteromonas marina]